MTTDTETDPYVQGWLDCAETIASLCDIKARDLDRRGGLLERIMNPPLAAIYRHAAEIARATTTVGRESGRDARTSSGRPV